MSITEPATCLGCGCTCDDIAVEVRDGRIVEARNACSLGRRWFGDGSVSREVRVRGESSSIEGALDAATELLGEARRALVYLAPDISCETQRVAVALADQLRGVLDSITSSTVAEGTLAAQRRGRLSATLGEIRNRADLLVFWGVDPATRYPRFLTRYAPEPEGVFVPGGRRDRTVIAVDVGGERGPSDADLRIALASDEEERSVAEFRAATVRGNASAAGRLAELASRLGAARYPVIVYDAEPADADVDGGRDHSWRTEAFIALTQQLSTTIRCSLMALRGGGNRNGAEAVMTWQTGYPMTVDYSRGAPRYRPDEGAARLLEGRAVDAVLTVGDARTAGIPALGDVRRVAIGPWASQLEPAAEVAIDTGVAGIHEGGMAFRMDEIPLPLRPSLPGPPTAPDTAFVVEELRARIRARARGAAAAAGGERGRKRG